MQKIRWYIAQFFEKFWWKNYLKKKDTQEYLVWKKEYWRTFLKEINTSLENTEAKYLDIGCGPAGTFILSEETQTYWKALDPLLGDYKKLDVFKEENYPNVNFVNSNFEDFESTETFDTIFCINAINHFINLKENFAKLNKILSENGTLILSTDAHNYSFLKWILYSLPLDILHPHQYTSLEYEKMITENGFEIKTKTLKQKQFIFSYYIYSIRKKTIR